MWEIPTMKVQTVDSKRRLVLTGAEPGESYAISQIERGHYKLTKVIPAPRKNKPTEVELDKLLSTSALTPKGDWEELRSLTRDP